MPVSAMTRIRSRTAIADGPWVKWYPGIPGYIDQQSGSRKPKAPRPRDSGVLNSVRA